MVAEFLAIAVKARRWVLVGDPEQLPPYNNGEENGVTLDDIITPMLELVCSVGAILENARRIAGQAAGVPGEVDAGGGGRGREGGER